MQFWQKINIKTPGPLNNEHMSDGEENDYTIEVYICTQNTHITGIFATFFYK